MKRHFWILPFVILIGACNQKKTDREIFDQGKVRVNLSSDVIRGYDPLPVSFSAYLETRETVVQEEIRSVKWMITGTGGFEQEILQESVNYQDEESNKDDFFYTSYNFTIPGKYRVRVIINDGEFISNFLTINVLENPNRRF